VVGAWIFLAPTALGGSTSYVTTHGASMAPRFSTGDLALVRPTDDYRVGQVAAYHSSVLHTVVLHRIIARKGDRYVFKGDNNHFVDPSPPTRGALIGTLRLRVPAGGRLLGWLRIPAVAAALIAAAVLLPRRGRRPARSPSRGNRPMTDNPGRADPRAVLAASAVAALACLALGVAAFTRPATKPSSVTTPYTERVSFGYGAEVPASPVYPDGVLRTGDPIFLRLVPRIHVRVDYGLASAAAHRVSGTQEIVGRLSSSTGWSRTFSLAPRSAFTGERAGADVSLDLARLQALGRRVDALTGTAPGSYTLTVTPQVRVAGTVAGRPLKSDYAPALSFRLDALQLRLVEQQAFTRSRRGTVATPSTAAATVRLRGRELPVSTARWITVGGFLLAATVAALVGLPELRRPARAVRS
jgi:signal peptidase I